MRTLASLAVPLLLAVLAGLTGPGARAAEAAGVLTVCDDVRDPATLDPSHEFSDRSFTILQQIFEGLLRFSAEGKLEGALATSYRRIDPLVLEFKLRPGVRFHDGTPLTADAVRQSIQWYLDPATHFPAREFLRPLSEVQVVDPATVRLKTSTPDALLPYRLAAFVLIVSPKSLAPGQNGFTPVGTGPFRFDRWIKGQELTLTANPDYWAPGLPRSSALRFRFLPLKQQIDEFLSGAVDIVSELPGTLTLEVNRNPRTRVVKALSFYTYTATFDTAQGPLSMREVRQALNYGVDRASLIKYYARGNGRPLAAISMPGEEGHNADLAPYPHDLERARALLDSCGQARPFTLKFLVKSQAEGVMRILARQWEPLGVTVELTVTDDAHQMTDLRSRHWDGYAASSPDPMCHMAFLPGIGQHSHGPFSLMRLSGFDARFDRMVATVDPDEHRRLAQELDRYIHDEALSVFTFQQLKTYGVRAGVEFVPSITGMPLFMHTRVP